MAMEAGSTLHAVQFYDNEDRLCSSVADFLAGGLTQGHLAIVIATATHAAGILQKLTDRRIDVDVARRLGDLVLLDARDLRIRAVMARGRWLYSDGSLPIRVQRQSLFV